MSVVLHVGFAFWVIKTLQMNEKKIKRLPVKNILLRFLEKVTITWQVTVMVCQDLD